MTMHKGVAVSKGIAIGRAVVIKDAQFSVERILIQDQAKEKQQFLEAIDAAERALEQLYYEMKTSFGDEEAAIIRSQMMILRDETFLQPIYTQIEEESVHAAYALQQTTKDFVEMFEMMEDIYMQERAMDIQDVSKRVLMHLLKEEPTTKTFQEQEAIIVAKDLTPSYMAQLDHAHVRAIVLEKGGATSHTAILARSMGIPTLTCVEQITQTIQDGDMLIVDGERGELLVNPTEACLKQYDMKMQEEVTMKQAMNGLLQKPTVTVDGHHVSLLCNVERAADVVHAKHANSDGIGLFRTEFLLLEHGERLTEERQYEVYVDMLQQMAGQPVTIRTFDIGGDKLQVQEKRTVEANPFLGYRAIRVSLVEQQLFRQQIRALLRASVVGELKIMFPMITTLGELRAAKAIVWEEKATLLEQGIAFDAEVGIGMMVETPAAALLAHQFAKEVDFFSIGTNDLIQYTMAADRLNERVNYLYEPHHPAILQLIQFVVQAAEKADIPVSVCGEMATDKFAVPLLLGLNIRQLSMASQSILPVKRQIRSFNMKALEKIAVQALQKGTSEEVLELVKTLG